MVIELKDVQFSNADSPICVTAVGIVIEVSLLILRQHAEGIISTDSPNVKDFTVVLSEKRELSVFFYIPHNGF